MRKLVVIIAALVPALAIAQRGSFLDAVNHPHASYIEFLHDRGIVSGYSEGIFRPDININRAEFLKILMLAVYGDEAVETENRNCFADFAGIEEWYWPYACVAKDNGIVSGYPDGTFRGNKNVILSEALKMSIEAWEMRKPQYPGGPPNWYDPYFDIGASRRLFEFFPYDPGHLITRSEMAVLLVILGQQISTVAPVQDGGETRTQVELPEESAADEYVLPDFEDDLEWNDDDWEDDDFDLPDDDLISPMPVNRVGVSNSNRKCASYMRFGEQNQICAVCGNGICEPFESCTPSFCSESVCSSDCGDLYCAQDCRNGGAVCGNGVIEGTEQCDDGNLKDGDGCSKICLSVSVPVYHAALRIDERPAAGSSELVPGSQNVLLFAFDASAGRQDVFLTGASFRSKTGDLAFASNYRIFIDMNADGSAETLMGNSSQQVGKLTFSNLYVPVLQGEPRRLELVADISNNAPSSSFSIGFDVSNPQYISAVGVDDGRDLSGIETDSGGCNQSICWIAVQTLSSAQSTPIAVQGNLFVTADTVPVKSRMVRAGELSQTLIRARLRAKGEDIEITDIAIAGGNEYIDQLEIYEENSTSPVAIARSSLCGTVTPGLLCAKPGSLIVGRDREKSIYAKAFIRPDAPADASGKTFSLYFTAGSSPQQAISARGKNSNKTLKLNDGDSSEEGEVFIGTDRAAPNIAVTGPTHDLAASAVVSIENAHSDPFGTRIPIGNSSFAAFRFRASERASSNHFPVTLRDITFNLAADGVRIDPSSVVIYNALDSGTEKSCSASSATGNIEIRCTNLSASAVETTINQGSSLTLAIKANIVESQMNPVSNTLQASLVNLGNRSSPGTISWDDGTTTFGWVDIEQARVDSTLYRS